MTSRVRSRTSGPRMRMPSWAPRPVPTMSAVGVASPRAHGQAMMRTATAAVNASAGSPVARSHPASVATEIAITTGTKTADTRSASRCTGALPVCAWATRRAIWARVVSAPTLVARTTRRPETLIVAPTTSSPGAVSSGRGSPVSIERSTADSPSMTIPSVGIRSPGLTTNSSPTWIPRSGTDRSASARMASPARRRARASRKRPRRMSVVITPATSKYVSAPSAKRSAAVDQVHAERVPRETSVSMVTARWRRFLTAARWNGQPATKTTGVASAKASHSHPSNWSGGTIATSASGTVNAAARASRVRTVSRCSSSLSPAGEARYPAASTAARSASTSRLDSS